MRKGQMEIMGLVIIVVLIMFAVLFVVRYVLLAPEEDLGREYKDSRLAANTLSALVGTTTTCHDAAMAALLEDCATGGNLRCPEGNSCVQASKTIELIFSETLEKWEKNYRLSVGGPGDISKLALNRGCTDAMLRETKSHILPTNAGLITLNLSICRSA